MLKNLLMRKMLQRQMKGVPQEEQDKMIALVEKNPELFARIAQEVQAEMKKGKDQTAASVEVMERHKQELQGLL
jgi:hypothetical protein